MPRDNTKNHYYQVGISRKSRVHHLVDTGVAGKTGADFIKMLVEDVDRLIHGEPAVVLSGLLEAKIRLQPFAEEALSTKTAPDTPEPVGQQQALLSRAARARKSYRLDEDEDDE